MYRWSFSEIRSGWTHCTVWKWRVRQNKLHLFKFTKCLDLLRFCYYIIYNVLVVFFMTYVSLYSCMLFCVRPWPFVKAVWHQTFCYFFKVTIQNLLEAQGCPSNIYLRPCERPCGAFHCCARFGLIAALFPPLNASFPALTRMHYW